MAQLMLGNIDEGATDEEIRAFLDKYGFPACQKIERVPGDGTRPAALVTFEGCDAAILNELRPRIHEIYWKMHKVNAMVLTESFG
jgi:hypothetical protein